MSRLGRAQPFKPHLNRVLRYGQTFTGAYTESQGSADTDNNLLIKPKTLTDVMLGTDMIRNLITNPSFEVDLTSWTSFGVGGTFSATLSRDTTTFQYGTASMKVVGAGAGGSFLGAQYTLTGLIVGAFYTVSCYAKGQLGTENFTLNIDTGNQSSQTLGTSFARYSVTFQATATSHVIKAESSTALAVYWVDAVQAEQNTATSPYFDGSFSGAAWEGTANASISDNNGFGLTFLIGYVFNETQASADSLIYLLGRVLTESQASADTVGSLIELFLSETQASADTLAKRMGATLSETQASADTLVKQLTYILTETQASVDTLQRLFEAFLTEAQASSDIMTNLHNGWPDIWNPDSKAGSSWQADTLNPSIWS